jgi:hypothetical protein
MVVICDIWLGSCNVVLEKNRKKNSFKYRHVTNDSSYFQQMAHMLMQVWRETAGKWTKKEMSISNSKYERRGR